MESGCPGGSNNISLRQESFFATLRCGGRLVRKRVFRADACLPFIGLHPSVGRGHVANGPGTR